MGIASGSVSFRRYQAQGKIPKVVDQEVVELLKAHAFGTAERAVADGTEVGWIAPTHLFDTEIELEKVTADRFLRVVMRVDRTAAPPDVVRSYRFIEERAAMEASGRSRLNKEERRQAAEAAGARAEREARRGAFRRITAHPLLFDPERRTVYFTSLGGGAHDKLVSLFASTFQARLEPLGAAELAFRHAGESGHGRSYEDASPAHLIESPANGEATGEEQDRSFLGREFLTWLWHEVDQGDGTIRLPADGRTRRPAAAAIVIDRTMQLDCDFKISGRDVFYGTGPARFPEARAALTTGKQPTKMGLVLAAGEDSYALTLEMPGLFVRGLKLPEVDEPSGSARLEERCRHIVAVADLLDALYGTFLKDRLGRDHAKRLGRLRQWAAETGPAGPLETSLRLAR